MLTDEFALSIGEGVMAGLKPVEGMHIIIHPVLQDRMNK
jgi:hypothetical protein